MLLRSPLPITLALLFLCNTAAPAQENSAAGDGDPVILADTLGWRLLRRVDPVMGDTTCAVGRGRPGPRLIATKDRLVIFLPPVTADAMSSIRLRFDNHLAQVARHASIQEMQQDVVILRHGDFDRALKATRLRARILYDGGTPPVTLDLDLAGLGVLYPRVLRRRCA